MTHWYADLDLGSADVLLCDADGTLFPSEEPAFEMSAVVTNRLLAHLEVDDRFTASELQALTNGKNFRASASDLAATYGHRLTPGDLEWWVAEEKKAVTRHLAEVLRPDPRVIASLSELARRFQLAIVTSSAATRLDACLEATGLAGLFPRDLRFSAEDSLPRPLSKPDPAIYTYAGRELGIDQQQGVAVEDSVNGTLSAVAAGFTTIGTVQFVPAEVRAARVEELRRAGAVAVVDDWTDLLPAPQLSG